MIHIRRIIRRGEAPSGDTTGLRYRVRMGYASTGCLIIESPIIIFLTRVSHLHPGDLSPGGKRVRLGPRGACYFMHFNLAPQQSICDQRR